MMNDIELIDEIVRRADEYQKQKEKEFTIAELEKIRAKITACTSQGEGDFCDIHNNAIELARKVVDNRISELKGENNEI